MTDYTPSQVRRLLAEYRGRRNSDLEQALRILPFERAQILFMTVCLENWRNGAHDWPEKVGDYWGSGGRSPRDGVLLTQRDRGGQR